MTPRMATTLKKIAALNEDNFPREPGKWGILLSVGNVSIHQPNGAGYVTIPRKQFDAIVDWYQRKQVPKSTNGI